MLNYKTKIDKYSELLYTNISSSIEVIFKNSRKKKIHLLYKFLI